MTPTCNLYTIFNTSFPADGGLILICTLQPTGGGKGPNVRENHMNNHATDTDPTDVPVWLLDTPNTAIARITRQATLQEIRTLIDDLIDEPDERGKGES